MGSERLATGELSSLQPLLERLSASGLPASVLMVDGALHVPGTEPPGGWRELRLRTPAGMVTLRRHTGGIGVIVFGNADARLQAAQRQIADAIDGTDTQDG